MKTLTKLITVLAFCFAGFANAQNPCGIQAEFNYTFNPNNVTIFKDTSLLDQGWVATSYFWDFGDGSMSTVQNPQHYYSTPGTYTACFIVTGELQGSAQSCADTFCRNVVVTPLCNSNLSVNFSYTLNGLSASFVANVTGGISPFTYNWDFGDGQTSTLTNPTYTYSSGGKVVRPCLKVTDASGCVKSICKDFYLANPGCPATKPSFNLSASSNTVTAVNSTPLNGVGAQFEWFIFNGGAGQHVPMGPGNDYAIFSNVPTGSNTVCLYLYNANGGWCDSACKSVNVPANPCAGVHANFTYSVSNSTVTLQSTSTGVNNSYYQWFVNGNAVSNVNPNTSFTYTSTTSGNLNICLKVFANSSGTSLCSDTCIVVNVPATNPCTGIQAAFWDTVVGNVVRAEAIGTYPTGTKYQWTLDNVSTTPSTNKTFYWQSVAAGTHTVCLIVYGSNLTACDTICKTVTVTSQPCNLNAGFQYTIQGDTVIFYPNPVPAGTSVKWNFGDNHDSQDTGVIRHIYPSQPTATTYNVCHKLQIPGSTCVDSFCQAVVIPGTGSNPCAGINASFTYSFIFGMLTLQSTSTGVPANAAYKWFMDGAAISQLGNYPSFTYTPTTSGPHNFCLKIYPANSSTVCSDTCITITIPNANPCAGVTAHIFDSILNGNTLKVRADAGPSGTRYQWQLDTLRTTIAPTNIQYVWQGLSVGTHYLCLYVYAANSTIPCDTQCKAIVITNPNPCNVNAGFQVSNTNIPGKREFNGNTNPAGAVYHWNFGDGTDATTTVKSTTHQYPANSSTITYNACLIVSIPGTLCADTFCQAVVIPGTTSTNCQARFTYTISNTGTVIFTNTSTQASNTTTYLWNFGDGTNTSSLHSPTHIYAAPGKYVVCLRITSGNCISEFCDTLIISNTNTCNASFQLYKISCREVKFYPAINIANATYQWTFGDGTGSQLTSPSHNYTAAGSYTVTLTIGYNGCQATETKVITIGNCPPNDTICGFVFNDNNSNGILDSTETPIVGAEVHIGNHVVFSGVSGRYQAIVAAGNYYIFVKATTGCIPTLPLSANSNTLNGSGYYVQGLNGGTFCGYNFGFNCSIVHICGTVYFDADNDGVKDTTEQGMASVKVKITDANNNVRFAYTNQHGEYCFTLPAGNYTITAQPSANYATCATTPQVITVAATTAGQQYGGKNFAVYCQPGQCNLKISVTPHTNVSPGFPAWYDMQVCNIGASASEGDVYFFYDPLLIFNNAQPAPTSHNASTQTLSWSLGTLLPGQCRYYMVRFNAPNTLSIGQPVFTLANVIPGVNCNDINLVNNVDTIHQKVSASWDPNNKLAYVTNYDDPAYQLVSSVSANQRIEYVINFQNTGNIPAVNVVVKDELIADIDVNSFELLGTSHPCIATINGNELNFKFSDIMLPAITFDEPNSHGFVKFAVNAVNGLPGGHVISDEAAIYFDYNAPVITNDAAVIMLEPTGIEEVDAVSITIAPNPMNEVTRIQLNSNNTDGFRFRVTDMAGRVVAEQMTTNNTLLFERNMLAGGVYTYQVIQNNKPVVMGKLVMQ